MLPSKPPCSSGLRRTEVGTPRSRGRPHASRVTMAPTLCLHYRTNEVTTYPLLDQVHAEVIGQSFCGRYSIGVAVYQENGRSRDCDGFRNAGGQCTLCVAGKSVAGAMLIVTIAVAERYGHYWPTCGQPLSVSQIAVDY